MRLLLRRYAEASRLTGLIRRKYGLEFRVVMAVERRLRSDEVRRVLLRITPD